jgi:electron transfer flavoprotein beta subunit
MHLAVCCKGIPEEPRNFSLSEDATRLNFEASSLVFNESDEYAVDEAIRWKKKIGAKVTAVTLGDLESQEILYVALAKGVDDALRVDSPTGSPWEVATLLGKAVEKKAADLVLVGVQSADHMGSLIGGLLAASLGWPFIFAVTSIDIVAAERRLIVHRELGEGRLQRLQLQLPSVLAVQTGICPLSYAPPARRLRARQKTLEVLYPEQLGFSEEALNQCRKERIEEIMPPVASRSASMLEGSPQEIARFLADRIREAT